MTYVKNDFYGVTVLPTRAPFVEELNTPQRKTPVPCQVWFCWRITSEIRTFGIPNLGDNDLQICASREFRLMRSFEICGTKHENPHF